jgi:hypothetical protein
MNLGTTLLAAPEEEPAVETIPGFEGLDDLTIGGDVDLNSIDQPSLWDYITGNTDRIIAATIAQVQLSCSCNAYRNNYCSDNWLVDLEQTKSCRSGNGFLVCCIHNPISCHVYLFHSAFWVRVETSGHRIGSIRPITGC